MLDQQKGWRAVEERARRTTDPRHRAMLENLRDHLLAEATVDFDKLVATLGPDPEYHFWIEGSGFDAGPKGRDAVLAHYRGLYDENRHVCEYDIERIVCDDDVIVTEGWFRQVYPGRVLAGRGVAVDDVDAAYLVTVRLVLLWPYDQDAKLVGEDSYADGGMFQPERIRKLAPDEIPQAFFQTIV